MQQENLGCFPDPQGPDSWGCGVQGPLGPTEMVAGMAFPEATALERILCLVHHLLLGHEPSGGQAPTLGLLGWGVLWDIDLVRDHKLKTCWLGSSCWWVLFTQYSPNSVCMLSTEQLPSGSLPVPALTSSQTQPAHCLHPSPIQPSKSSKAQNKAILNPSSTLGACL